MVMKIPAPSVSYWSQYEKNSFASRGCFFDSLHIGRFLFCHAPGETGPNHSAPRLDAWRVLGPGGGGAQFFPAVSPHDPNLVLVACDMTGAYISENGGQSWRMFNLRNPVTFFAFDPQDPKVIYAGADALWRSDDRGRTWGLVYPSSPDVRLIMPDDHASPVYLAHQEPAGRVLALAVDPDDSRKLYATIREKDGVGLYFSGDRGAQWQRLTERELRGGGRKILIDPHSPAADRTLYILGDDSVTVRKGGQFIPGRSPEGVQQAADMSAGFTSTGQLIIYLVGGGERRDSRRGIFISKDGGESWGEAERCAQAILDGRAPVAELTSVATSLNHAEVAYVSYEGLDTGSGVFTVWPRHRIPALPGNWFGKRERPRSQCSRRVDHRALRDGLG